MKTFQTQPYTLTKSSLFSLLGVAFFLVLMPFSETKAQGILDRALERTKNKVKNRVDNKIDKAVDKSLDKTEESLKTGKKDKQNADGSEQEADAVTGLLGGMLGGGGAAQVAEAYQFNSSFLIEMTSQKAKGKKQDPMWVRYRQSSQNQEIIGMEVLGKTETSKPQSQSVLDFQNQAMVILMENEGANMAVVSAFPKEMQTQEQAANEKPVKVTKTNEKKSILGYPCAKYIIESDDFVSNAWITQDIKIEQFKAMRAFVMANKKQEQNPMTQIEEGFVLEMENTDKKTGDKSFILVKEVKLEDAKSFQMSNYQIVGGK
ncbi:DUF4412 domain-containing protein [Hugenholtzia roseola]|uniref:DUF4412 domain-containing protein n=1 Tax=Hugenholtzia roseola TaxID=1002 RepID=UPI0003FD856C|nr:DUF4412 domain-containing protein [Hugenholtzia roseola]